jgi:hypothetical protein
MDVHVPAAITRGLLLRGVDVLTAQVDGTTALEDPALLDWATALGCVLFRQDLTCWRRRPFGSVPGSRLRESFTDISCASPLESASPI